ncbi:MAG: APC family permease [Elusimicrobia bacterium]|nr:APC family permease [Elusimicrobiota bacterium]
MSNGGRVGGARQFHIIPASVFDRIRLLLLGAPHDLNDPQLYHRVSLVAFLAWIGLGADGLSSSCYGPDEAFRALGSHAHLAILLAIMTAVTIFVIALSYSDVIEHFPGGGGGYLVATKLLGEKAGMVSGCALIVDYILTITVSVASGCDAVWSFLPPDWAPYKLWGQAGLLLVLVLLNLRGVKESVTILAPIFILFVATHAFAILYAVGSHFTGLPMVFHGAAADLRSSVQTIGPWAVGMILLRAYCMGGGTYTGIEAVSNGMVILREPRVQTGKKTMALMAVSLAFTAGGIILGYLLMGSAPQAGKTMNAVFLGDLFGSWTMFGLPAGKAFVILILFSEAAILFVAAQAGFLAGPRVLANMAVDSWVPRMFAQLSERLVAKDGVLLMGAAALGVLFYARGNISTLVVMYSINVFLTFSLSMLGMARQWLQKRGVDPRWKSRFALQSVGLVLCASVLGITLFEKFSQGGWFTVLITGCAVGLCFLIRKHYNKVRLEMRRLDSLMDIPLPEEKPVLEPMDKKAPTAVVMVGGFSGFGLHQILSIQKLFPYYFKNFVFLSVGVVDSGNFKGAAELQHLETQMTADLERYVAWCQAHGFQAAYRYALDTETIPELEKLCVELSREFPRAIFFSGKLIFKEEKFIHQLLHNETALALQSRLQFAGLQTIVLPIRAT